MRRFLLALVSVAAILACFFFAIGGLQVLNMLRGPQLPVAEASGSPDSDLTFLRAAVLANERGATEAQRQRFQEIVDGAAPPLNVDELTLTAFRGLAVFDNAHTTPISPLMHRLPIRVHWTADALVIVKARPPHANLLGRRIISLGGRTPEEMLSAMPQLVGGGTPAWVRYRSEYFYTAPAALAALGSSAQSDGVEIRTIDASGNQELLTLTADPEPMRGDPFWDFLNSLPGDEHFDTQGWATLLRRDQELPLYQQEPDRLYLLRALPEIDAVYVRMNGSINDESETISQFTQRTMSLVERSDPSNVIVDFRYNRGGDYTSVLPLVRGLSRAIPAEGRLYLITGPNTFSAGLLAGAQFKRFVPDRLTVVGEEVGDRLRFRGEGVTVRLPATGVEVYLSTAWDDVESNCGWFDDCWPPNKFLLRGVGNLDPDIRVANTWASYRDARDLMMESVSADIQARSTLR